jgi:DNA primase
MENWVDFRAVKESVSMEQMLAHYRVSLRRVSSSSLRGKCPLPTHSSKESKESFAVDTAKNIWSCLSSSCVTARGGSKGGNVLDFAAAMERCGVREAAMRIAERFRVAPPPNGGQITRRRAQSPPPEETVAKPSATAADAENEALKFSLQGVAYCDYLRSRGISEETAARFGAGHFPGRGTMSGRVVVPIHSERGELVAYAGRAVDDADPKYRFPAGFHKSRELFNLHRAGGDEVIVVEGFFDAMKVHQAGFPHVVALMGSALSERQRELLLRFRRLVLMLDGDDAGRAATAEIAAKLVYSRFVRAVSLAEGAQPDQLSSDDLARIIGAGRVKIEL